MISTFLRKETRSTHFVFWHRPHPQGHSGRRPQDRAPCPGAVMALLTFARLEHAADFSSFPGLSA